MSDELSGCISDGNLYCNYSLILTSIVATLVQLEINGESEHRYSSRLSGSLL